MRKNLILIYLPQEEKSECFWRKYASSKLTNKHTISNFIPVAFLKIFGDFCSGEVLIENQTRDSKSLITGPTSGARF